MALVLAFACGGRTHGNGSHTGAEYHKVRAARSELLAARAALDRIQSEAQEGRADALALRRAQATFDAAYARDQKALAAFLTVALNEKPAGPETREALGLYAGSAVANARILLDRGGDLRRAVETLEATERLFRAIGLPPPGDLLATLAEARRVQADPPPATPTPTPRAPSPARPHRRSARAHR